jgi:Fe-S-cluster containining protein
MNQAEYVGAAKHLGMDTQRFLTTYAKSYSKRPGWRLLRRKHRSADCIFLKADKTCSIYGARPLQCSTYPWWPELMGQRAWAAEAQVVCEGIGHADAPPLDVAAAAAALRAQTAHEAEHSGAVLTSRTGGAWNL